MRKNTAAASLVLQSLTILAMIILAQCSDKDNPDELKKLQ